MSCAEAAVALAPWAGDLEAEHFQSLASDVCLQEGKFILNPVLPLCHFLESLATLGLDEFSKLNALGFERSLAHFHRLLLPAGEPLPQAFLPDFVPKVLVSPYDPGQSLQSHPYLSLLNK